MDVTYTVSDWAPAARRRQRRWRRPPPAWPAGVAQVRTVHTEHLQRQHPPTAHRPGTFIIASVGPDVVGYAWTRPMVGIDGTLYIEEVAVATKAQGQGIGTELLRQVARFALDHQMPQLSAVSGRGNWLLRAGFRHVQRDEYEAAASHLLDGGT